jgi:hypothetical protein
MELGLLAICFVAGAAVMALWNSHQRLTKRISDLEKANHHRLPFRTAEEIEDATAAILKAMREIEFDKSMLENALGHLKNARNNR